MVKCSRYRPCVAQRVGIVIALHFHDRGTGRGWMVSSTPCPNFTPRIDPVPILQEVGWAPGLVWTCGKSRPHQDSIPTLKSVVSCYTDWATRPTNFIYIYIYIYINIWSSKTQFIEHLFINILCFARLYTKCNMTKEQMGRVNKILKYSAHNFILPSTIGLH
jgi:hypothetical protein